MEEGRLATVWSSRKIKRLMYVTERRIRYAVGPRRSPTPPCTSSPGRCTSAPEPGFRCGQYMGNVRTTELDRDVEWPAGPRKLYYMVALISNVLGRTRRPGDRTPALAARIHRLIGERARREGERARAPAGRGAATGGPQSSSGPPVTLCETTARPARALSDAVRRPRPPRASRCGRPSRATASRRLRSIRPAISIPERVDQRGRLLVDRVVIASPAKVHFESGERPAPCGG